MVKKKVKQALKGTDRPKPKMCEHLQAVINSLKKNKVTVSSPYLGETYLCCTQCKIEAERNYDSKYKFYEPEYNDYL